MVLRIFLKEEGGQVSTVEENLDLFETLCSLKVNPIHLESH